MNDQKHPPPGPATMSLLFGVSTPGRICLFGEHQDYLDLPVISAAISLRLSITATRRTDNTLRLSAPDIGKEFDIDPSVPPADAGWNKFLWNGYDILRREGRTFSRGFDCVLRGEIPIRCGTSSSSAMVVSWVHLLSLLSDSGVGLTREECALLAHRAEVIEAGGVGGKMDQYATAVGGVLYQTFLPRTRVEALPVSPGPFVLGDSLTPKDTQAVLARVKDRVLGLVNAVKLSHPSFSLASVTPDDLDSCLRGFSHEDTVLMRATVANRDITARGKAVLAGGSVDPHELGALLNEQHSILGGILGISTEKIDSLIDGAVKAGAAGCKINGSGGGGCMFAYAPGCAG
ncbi:MAG TPA: galactokinase family protein, partial [Bacteroidota bacterium]|nr:galactokinase family protein [Bacteroidota bacterium]